MNEQANWKIKEQSHENPVKHIWKVTNKKQVKQRKTEKKHSGGKKNTEQRRQSFLQQRFCCYLKF
jgi:hypothetical protein